jgi:hypothetical protein
MSLTTPLPSPGPVPSLASSWLGPGLSPEASHGWDRPRRCEPRWPGSSATSGGHVVHAQSVPPASQNQGAIEADLVAFAPSVLDLPQAEAVHRLEMLIRAYDPCISCATHFLDLRIVEDRALEGNA